jgi:hypothetical protein
MRRWLKRKSPEEIMEMMGEMMQETLWEMTPKDMSRMMQAVMPQMTESCFLMMTVERRKSKISMCPTMLDQIEATHA